MFSNHLFVASFATTILKKKEMASLYGKRIIA
jgi:hypothetical protein